MKRYYHHHHLSYRFHLFFHSYPFFLDLLHFFCLDLCFMFIIVIPTNSEFMITKAAIAMIIIDFQLDFAKILYLLDRIIN